MTVYLSNKATLDPVKLTPEFPPKYLPGAGGVNVLATYQFPASGSPTLTSGDTILGPYVPAGAVIMGITLDVDKLDGGGSPALVLNVGDAASANRFIKNSTVGQAGGYAIPNINGALGFTYAATGQIIITVGTTANGAVPANAMVRLAVEYTMDP